MSRRKMVYAAAAVALLLSVWIVPRAARAGVPGVTLEVVPSTTMVLPGGSVGVDIVVSGLGDMAAPSLGTFDLVLEFDPAVFAFNGLAFGLELGDEMAMEATTGTMVLASGVEVFELSLLSPAALNAQQPGSFVLFSATFDAVSIGGGLFDLTVTALGDENGAPLILAGIVPATVTTGSILDIPTLSQWGLILLAAALLFLGFQRLRRVVQ